MTPDKWFHKLSPEMQRRLVQDPGQSLEGDLGHAVLQARDGIPATGHLLHDEVAWLSEDEFLRRHSELELELLHATMRDDIEETDPDTYAAMSNKVAESESEVARLFEGRHRKAAPRQGAPQDE